jgi:hypothetical protein
VGLKPPQSAAVAVLAATLMLVWPAFLNGYPILFSDTGAFLAQTVQPLMIWDKPWIYGPLLHLLHWNTTLWLPLLAQGLVVSHLLWLSQRAVRGYATAAAHLLLCLALGTLTALPWVAALLMPDVLAPVAVLSLFLLGIGRAALSQREAAWLGLLATLALAAHLSHLPLAAALVLATAVLTRRLWPAMRVAGPLAAALLLLLVTNWGGHGRLSLSPYGVVFVLARMIDDGPALRTIEARCPGSGWSLCASAGSLGGDSDVFLWGPDSPVNRDEVGRPIVLGAMRLAPEAREIVAETIRREPLALVGAMLRNFGRQLVLAGVGDTLVADHLEGAVRPRIAQGFPPAELARYDASAQVRGLLPARALPMLWSQGAVLLGSALGLGAMAWRLRGPGRCFALFLLMAVAANAMATGPLSKPHHRYQARIAWLMPLGVMVLALPRRDATARA